MFHKKGVLKRFGKFTGKHLRLILFFVKLQALSYAALLKKRLRDRCFAVNFPNFLSTFFKKEHLRWLLLDDARNYVRVQASLFF